MDMKECMPRHAMLFAVAYCDMHAAACYNLYATACCDLHATACCNPCAMCMPRHTVIHVPRHARICMLRHTILRVDAPSQKERVYREKEIKIDKLYLSALTLSLLCNLKLNLEAVL